MDRFMRQFRVHISRLNSVIMLATLKQRTGESLRSFLTRFNAAVASADRSDPSRQYPQLLTIHNSRFH